MNVQTDGSYKASTTRGSTSEGQFYLQDGKLRVSIVTNDRDGETFGRQRQDHSHGDA